MSYQELMMGKRSFLIPNRIIKIWDKDSLILQASLHGHTDVITDMDISKCNRYIASASKDGKAIVWDLEKCTVVDRLPSHADSVNNIRFFKFQIKRDSSGAKTKEEIQVLITCSDDGSIRIYDEHGYLYN
jgi:WD40 repeat protein